MWRNRSRKGAPSDASDSSHEKTDPAAREWRFRELYATRKLFDLQSDLWHCGDTNAVIRWAFFSRDSTRKDQTTRSRPRRTAIHLYPFGGTIWLLRQMNSASPVLRRYGFHRCSRPDQERAPGRMGTARLTTTTSDRGTKRVRCQPDLAHVNSYRDAWPRCPPMAWTFIWTWWNTTEAGIQRRLSSSGIPVRMARPI